MITYGYVIQVHISTLNKHNRSFDCVATIIFDKIVKRFSVLIRVVVAVINKMHPTVTV